MSRLRSWENGTAQSTSLSFVLTANYESENKSSQYQYNILPQHVFQFVHNVRFFM